MVPINKMTIYVTRHCNLKCSYCFVAHQNEFLHWEIAKKSLDWLIHRASGNIPNLSVGFFGGEPLLAYDIIARLIEYGHEECSKIGKEIHFSMTTNGLLLNRDRLSFFSQYPVGIALSIDGMKKSHDMFRKKPDGSGTFEDLLPIIPLFLEYIRDNVARVTVNPETAGFVYQNIAFLIAQGFKNLALGFNSDVLWTLENLETLDTQLRNVANYYLELMMQNTPVRISLFDNSLNNLISRTSPLAACGAGKGFVNIGLQGDIYPCHHFACLDSFKGAFKIGHIDSGIHLEARLPFLRHNAGKMLGCYTSCGQCKAKPICGGGCFAKGYERSGMLQMPDPIEQKFMLIIYDIVEQIYRILKQNTPPAFRERCKNLGFEEICDE